MKKFKTPFIRTSERIDMMMDKVQKALNDEYRAGYMAGRMDALSEKQGRDLSNLLTIASERGKRHLPY